MKYLWMILVLLAVSVPAVAEDFEVTEAQYVVISGDISDTLGRTRIEPDSIRIFVSDSAQTTLFDAWFLPASDQVTIDGGILIFSDQWEDINGAASVGIFHIVATFASDGDNNIDLYTNQNYTLRGLTNTTEAVFALTVANGDLSNYDGATPLVVGDIWEADTATYNGVANSYGLILAKPSYVQGAGGDPWSTALPGAYGSGTAGKIVGDNINATISSRSTFDNTSDSVIVDVSSAGATNGLLAQGADSNWAAGTRTITGDTYTPDVSVVSMANDVITYDAIKDGAINAANIGANAFTAAKFAPDVANEFAAYPPYTYKMVVRGSPTTITFEVSYIVDGEGNSPSNETDDFCLGMLIQAQDGGSNAKAVIIADFTIADSAFTVRPGFASSMNVGDTVFIRPIRGAVEPSDWTQHVILLSGGGAPGRVRADSVEDVRDSTGFTDNFWTAVANAAGGLDTLSTAFVIALIDLMWSEDSTGYSGIDMAYLASQTGASGSTPDSLIARVDSLLIILRDSVYAAIGFPDLTDSPPARYGDLHDKIGDWLGIGNDDLKKTIGDYTARTAMSILDTLRVETATILAVAESLMISVGYDGEGPLDFNLQEKMGSRLITELTVFALLDSILNYSASAGTGANTCSLWVYDTGNSVTVSGIMVRGNNSSGADQGHARTNVSGIAVLNYDDGSYSLRIPMNSDYIQTTNPLPFTVSGATNDTIEVTMFSPSAPEGDLCKVYNWIKDASDNGIRGVTVTAKIPTAFWPITKADKGIRATKTTKTNGSGYWEMSIFPSSLLLTTDSDSASYYQFTDSEKLYGDDGYKVTVPADATFKMVPDSLQ